MGIPRFFRWLSERYPLCGQVVVENEIPEFDNLYLDMNGIIHNCCRSENITTSGGLMPEHELFFKIFNYVECLFRKIKPKKVFFLAIDGVAPRAKMNQQRSRRFRSALEAERESTRNPLRPAFDGNSITPGTAFMARLDEWLQLFLRKKVSEDAAWRDVHVIFSGHCVPGEGEHKIMEFIRLHKAQDAYNPNTRHCLYGLDADLIMLGLVTHDPHFCLLREEVTFGGSSKPSNASRRQPQVDNGTFHLLHLCLVREYLQLEFESLIEDGQLSFAVDAERVIDDFIFFSILVGNDFLPGLSFLDIQDHAYECLFSCYARFLNRTNSYLTLEGRVRYEMVAIFFGFLRDAEVEHCLNGVSLLTDAEKSVLNALVAFVQDDQQKTFASDSAATAKFLKKVAADIDFDVEMRDHRNRKSPFVVKKPADFSVEDVVAYLQDLAERSGSVDFLIGEWKTCYYEEKLGDASSATVDELCFRYLQGMQWVLLYYYEGVPSWTWFFNFHYAPKIWDLARYLRDHSDTLAVEFVEGVPSLPFEQLMAVLPPASAHLVPEVLSTLMTSASSPVVSFYPQKFATDLNGKTRDWEAVVLIPFIDADALKSAMAPLMPRLSAAERARNSLGATWSFRHVDDDVTQSPCRIPPHIITPYFAAGCLDRCHFKEFNLPVLGRSQSFVKGLCDGVRLGIRAISGFPTLFHMDVDASLEAIGVKVFSFASKLPSLVLTVHNEADYANCTAAPVDLIGKTVYSHWPYLKMYRVAALTDGVFEWTTKGRHELNDPLLFDCTVQRATKEYRTKYAVNIGETRFVAFLHEFVAVKELSNGSRQRVFSHDRSVFPVQMLVSTVHEEDARFVECGPRPIASTFSVGTQCVYVGPFDSYYGGAATVSGHRDSTIDAAIAFVPTGVSFSRQLLSIIDAEEKYYDLLTMAHRLKHSVKFISLITSMFFVDTLNNQSMNVGFPFKSHAKNTRVLGISRKVQQRWELSATAVNILHAFCTQNARFCDFFESSLRSHKTIRHMQQVVGYVGDDPKEQLKELTRVKACIAKSIPENLESVPVDGEKLSAECMQKFMRTVDAYVAHNPPKKAFVSQISRDHVLNPAIVPNLRQELALGDRVTVAFESAKLPVGTVGTIVGVLADNKFQVLTDVSVTSFFENTGNCEVGRGFFVDGDCLLNLSSVQPPNGRFPSSNISAHTATDTKRSSNDASSPTTAPKSAVQHASASDSIMEKILFKPAAATSAKHAIAADLKKALGIANCSTNSSHAPKLPPIENLSLHAKSGVCSPANNDHKRTQNSKPSNNAAANSDTQHLWTPEMFK